MEKHTCCTKHSDSADIPTSAVKHDIDQEEPQEAAQEKRHTKYLEEGLEAHQVGHQEQGYSVKQSHSQCHSPKRSIDIMLWSSVLIIALSYAYHWTGLTYLPITHWFTQFTQSIFQLMNQMWWGILIGISMVAALSKVPREFVMSVLGTKKGKQGIIRAAIAGVLLDMCSHGILMVASKLYERGASTGQVMAFLVASPWNSFSFTLILFALIGFYWTMSFILISLVMAILVGILFQWMESRQIVAVNPYQANAESIDVNFRFFYEARKQFKSVEFDWHFWRSVFVDGIAGSQMVIRWILFGVVLASTIRLFAHAEIMATYFGPTLAGLGLTLFFATIIEVCSEGSVPIAADLMTRAGAPGNSFAFLMAGVATDYTEIAVLKETTGSWKVALLLPAALLPQVIFVAWLLNQFAVAI
jgi:uncharacterized protein